MSDEQEQGVTASPPLCGPTGGAAKASPAKPAAANASILQQVRSDGYRDGWGQASMCAYDEAFWRGQTQAEDEYFGIRFRWFLLGLLLGGAFIGIVA